MNAVNVIPLSAPEPFACGKSASPAALNPVRVRFDAFELDEPNAFLLRNGKAVALAPKPFAVLCALARRPGSLLTKHALLDDVWGHQFVSDSVWRPPSARSGRCSTTIPEPRSSKPCPAWLSLRCPDDGDTEHLAIPGRRAAGQSTSSEQPVFATMEEVRYAHELRLQLRARLLRDAAPPTQPWCVGAD